MDYNPWGHKESGTTEQLTPRPCPLTPCSWTMFPCWSSLSLIQDASGEDIHTGPQDWNLSQLMVETQAWPGPGVTIVCVAPVVWIVS